MIQVFTDIQNKLLTDITQAALAAIGIQTEQPITVQLFNDQWNRIKTGEMIPTSFPLLVVGWESPAPAKQLGNGVQMFDPFYINVNAIREFYDNGDGSTDQDLIIYKLSQLVYASLQEFEPTKVCKMVRCDDIPPEKHLNYVKYGVKFRANLVDASAERPVGGIASIPPYTLVVTPNRS